MGFYEHVNNFNYFLNFKLVSSEELVLIFLFYNFIKSIIFGSLFELLWPTQFFNKKNNINYTLIRYRSFNEFVIKLRIKNVYFRSFYKICLKYFFKKN